MSEQGDPGDNNGCTDVYDTAGALMAIHNPTPAGGLFALGTHLAGSYFCSGGTFPQPGPPDYFGGKLGYDPGHETPPTFSLPTTPPDLPYMDMGAHDAGFDYVAADSHSSSGGFDYGAADTHTGSTVGSETSYSDIGSSSADASSASSSEGGSTGSSSGSI